MLTIVVTVVKKKTNIMHSFEVLIFCEWFDSLHRWNLGAAKMSQAMRSHHL